MRRAFLIYRIVNFNLDFERMLCMQMFPKISKKFLNYMNEYKRLTAASSASVLVCLTSLVPQDTTCILVMEYIISNIYMDGMARK